MKMKHQGYLANRLSREPLEALFAKVWQEQNDAGSTLAYILTGAPSWDHVSERDVAVAASVIQWLGSAVGQAFLEEVHTRG
jgi:hypothetical protein